MSCVYHLDACLGCFIELYFVFFSEAFKQGVRCLSEGDFIVIVVKKKIVVRVITSVTGVVIVEGR